MSPDTRWFHDKRVELTDLNKEERSRLRAIVGAVILGIFIFGTLLYAVGSFAEGGTFSSVDEDGKLTITQDPCEKAGPWFAKWRAAQWMWRGKNYDACWSVAQTRDGGRVIVVIDSDGQISNIEPRRFRPEDGI